jgi:hypothetical protein
MECRITENPGMSPPARLATPSDSDVADLDLDMDMDFDFESARAGPSNWPGKDAAGIAAWAANVPAGACGAPSPPPSPAPASASTRASTTSTPASSSSSRRSSLSRSSASLRPPALVRQQTARHARPSICLSRPQAAPVEPTLPIATPVERLTVTQRAQRQLHPHSQPQQQPQQVQPQLHLRQSVTTLATATTESALPTPATSVKDVPSSMKAKAPPFFRHLAQHVRAWGSSARASTPQIAVLDGLEKAAYLARRDPDEESAAAAAATVYVASGFGPGGGKGGIVRQVSRCALDDHPAFGSRGRKPRH